jgi:hypothetical protein
MKSGAPSSAAVLTLAGLLASTIQIIKTWID